LREIACERVFKHALKRGFLNELAKPVAPICREQEHLKVKLREIAHEEVKK